MVHYSTFYFTDVDMVRFVMAEMAHMPVKERFLFQHLDRDIPELHQRRVAEVLAVLEPAVVLKGDRAVLGDSGELGVFDDGDPVEDHLEAVVAEGDLERVPLADRLQRFVRGGLLDVVEGSGAV